jgi:hypothetical protein
MNRYFRRSDGAWLHDMYAGSALDIAADIHIASVAERHGLDPGDIVAVEADEDPRTGDLVMPELPPPPPPPPDVGNFKLAIFGALGKDHGRALAREYVEFLDALNAGNFEIARAAMDDALADEALTQGEYDTLLALWEQFNLPEPDVGD